MRIARMEGDMTMATLANFLRPAAARFVVDKTGLTGSYRVTLEYDRMASIRGPSAAPAPDAAPSVFTAVQEQLGMRLESSRAERDLLVIDRLERPTEELTPGKLFLRGTLLEALSRGEQSDEHISSEVG